jgi:predicted acylesterase/phospholipase RssA
MFFVSEVQDREGSGGVRWSGLAERRPELGRHRLFPVAPNLPGAAPGPVVPEAPGRRKRPAVVALVGITPRSRSLVYLLADALVKAGERPYVLAVGREPYCGRRTEGQGALPVGNFSPARGALLRERLAFLCQHHEPVLLDMTLEGSGWELPGLLAPAQEVWWLVEAGTCEPPLRRLQALLGRAPELAGHTRLVWVRHEGEPLPPAGRHRPSCAAPDFQVTLAERDGRPVRLQRRDLARLARHWRRRRLGLARGGGGMRGAAHIGVLRALERAEIFPDLISGSSIGAVIGAAYSWGYSPDAILEIFQEEVAFGRLLRRVPGAGLLKTWSLFRFGGWRRILRRYLADATLEQLAIPLYPVSVDLIRGTCVVRERGDVVEALLESCNLPGFTRPILRDGAALADGGVLNKVPGDVARARGADVVVGVNLSFQLAPQFGANGPTTPADQMQCPGLLKVLLRLLAVQEAGAAAGWTAAVDLMINPDISAHGFFHYGKFAELAEAGEAAAEQAIPVLRGLLANRAA